LESFGINCVIGDQFYSDFISQHLQKLGISYELLNFSTLTRGKPFSGLKHLMVQDKIEILDDPDLLWQLRNLRDEKNSRGQIDVRPSSGMDDKAVALALAANELARRPVGLPPPQLGFVEILPSRSSLRLNPGSCRLEGNMRKFSDLYRQGLTA
jgi:hypothetical protein